MRRSVALALLSFSLAAALPGGAPARVPDAPRPRSAATVKADRIRAYEEARADLFALEADPKRRRFRHHWLNVAKRLDAMGDRKDHPRRCEALYNAGRAFAGLAEVSYLRGDRQEAVERYRRLARACPKSNLADDALLRAAELLAEADPQAARFELDRLFRLYPDGDMVSRARTLAASLKRSPGEGERIAASGSGRRPGAEAVAKAGKAEKAAAEAEPRKSETSPGRAVARAPAAEAKEAMPAEDAGPAAEPGNGHDPLAAIIASVANAPPAAAGAAAASVKTSAPAETTGSAKAPASATKAVSGNQAGSARSAAPGTPGTSTKSTASVNPAASAASATAATSATPTTPAPTPAPTPEAAPAPDADRLHLLADLERSTGAEFTLSALAGLKVRRVVIDPGHGGNDPGAIGRRGTHEATITLAIAKKLRRHLENLGLEVLFTREKDTTVSLEERTAFANERRADLFISIHCNAAENRKLRGVETYTLNLNSDRYAMRLAARENAGSERSVGDLQLILADLATKANTDDSVRLAAAIHGETVGRLSRKWSGVKDLGTKQALFFVLLGAKMPAVLFEASFLSHPEEEARLRTDAYQEEIARGIAAGVRRFISDREAIARAPGVPD